MALEIGPIGEISLRFYSRISASISHEVKNALAIINENAGLLEDFSAMAQKGMPLDPERLKNLAAMMHKQVDRAGDIMNKVNQFAHSLDQPVAKIDLNETLRLFFELTRRYSEMRHVNVELKTASQPVIVETSSFFLIILIWDLLNSAGEDSTKKASATLASENTDQGARVILGLKGFASDPCKVLADRKNDGFLKLLKAELTSGASDTELYLNLPARLAE